MILVTGASGHLGAAVVNELLNRVEATEVAVLTRDAAKVDAFAAKGVTVKIGDYDHYDSLVAAFKGVDKLYFVSGNDIQNRMKQHENVVNAAKEAGVGHIVYTSFQRATESKDSVIGFVGASHIGTEEFIKASGITYTILKHALYLEVIPLFIGGQVIESGVLYLPAEDGKVAFASRADMAEGGAIVLSTTGHENKEYDFASDTAYSFGEIAEILSKLSGKEIAYVSPSPEEFTETLKGYGVPEEGILVAAGFSAGIAEGEFEAVDATLKDLLGHELITLPTFLKGAYNL